MPRHRPARVQAITGIGVDRIGALADQGNSDSRKGLRLENLDVDIPPDPIVREITAQAVANKEDNSYLPFTGQLGLRETAAAHVSRMNGDVVKYSGERNCVISAGGLAGVLNTLLATVEAGDGVLMTDPTYSGLINRVKLACGVPVLVPLDFRPGSFWNLNQDKLHECIKSSGVKVTAMLLTSPALPSGCLFGKEDWDCIAGICVENDILLILDTAFERLLFDDRKVVHPASLAGMAERTVTVGSASKELRMIGWRIGWIVGPDWLMPDIGLVSMANVVCNVGIAQKAVQAALQRSADSDDIPKFVQELQARRDLCMEELKGLPVGVPAGGWAFVMRVGSLGFTGKEASEALVREGVYVTSMDGWGEEHGSQYIRFVFSNEPCERLKGIGAKVRKALNVNQ